MRTVPRRDPPTHSKVLFHCAQHSAPSHAELAALAQLVRGVPLRRAKDNGLGFDPRSCSWDGDELRALWNNSAGKRRALAGSKRLRSLVRALHAVAWDGAECRAQWNNTFECGGGSLQGILISFIVP